MDQYKCKKEDCKYVSDQPGECCSEPLVKAEGEAAEQKQGGGCGSGCGCC